MYLLPISPSTHSIASVLRGERVGEEGSEERGRRRKINKMREKVERGKKRRNVRKEGGRRRKKRKETRR